MNMSTVNVYFTQGTRNEQLLIEDLIIESLRIYGVEMVYIPRQLVSKDDILGEDRLSTFKDAYNVEMYFENVDDLGGQGFFMSKFGLMVEQSATLVVSRRRWEQLIGRYDTTIIPERPCEGDLIYFPLTGGLFEIKFVQHQNPFYQLGKLYVYKLQVELYQYASERIDTGIGDIDVFESLKTFDVDPMVSKYGTIDTIKITNMGSGYTVATASIVAQQGKGAVLEPIIVDGKIADIKIISGGSGYRAGSIVIDGDGFGALATVSFVTDIDKVESYGDNNSFKEKAKPIIFDQNNPFNE